MGDTSLVFNLTTRDNTSSGMRSARSTVESESAAMADAVEQNTSKMSEHFNNVSLAAGAALGGGLAAGISDAMEMGDASAKLEAQLGNTTADVGAATATMQKVFRAGWGESATEVGEAIKGISLNIGDVSKSAGGLEGVTTKVMALGQAFDQDLNGVTAAAGQLMRTGLAKNADEALDIIAKGLGSSANKADDFLDTVNEYSVQFKRVGLSGAQMTGLLQQGLKAGARDADAVADAVGIFGEMALAGGDQVNEAFKSIGLNGPEMGKKMRAGGAEAASALQMTMDALRGTDNETTKLAAAQTLFGDLANTQADALFALNPATAATGKEMKNLSGAASDVSKKMEASPTHQMNEAFRQFKETISSALIPVLQKITGFMKEHPGAARAAAQAIFGLIGAILLIKGAMATVTAAKAVMTGFSAVANSTAIKSIGSFVKTSASAVANFVKIAASAAANGARMAASWLASTIPAMARFVVQMIRTAIVAAAQFVMMAARAVIWAATMAAQWLIAMGPVGWIIMAVIALVALIVANWDKIKQWTIQAWNAVWGFIKGAAKKIWDFFLNWTIIGLVIKHWSTIKEKTVSAFNAVVNFVKGIPGKIASAISSFARLIGEKASAAWNGFKRIASEKATAFIGWVKGLPGRIASNIGNLKNLLVEKGKNVVTGLWNGIKGMGTWIYNKITGWAKDMIPGPIAKALGIASPSKVTAEQGKWIGKGLVVGLQGTEKQVRSTITKLRGIITKGLSGSKEKSALKFLNKYDQDLIAMAKGSERLDKSLKSAKAKLDGLKKSKAEVASKLRDSIMSMGNVVQLTPQDGFVDASSIIQNMQAKLNQAKEFGKKLAELRKKGLSNALLKQIAEAGPEQGMATATALAGASNSQIKQLNSTQAQLGKTANSTSKSLSNSMYNAGIKATEGLVKGMQARKKSFDDFIKSWAKYISASMKKHLGIKSPSKVMADQVGKWIPLGVIDGIKKTEPELTATTQAMVNAPKVDQRSGMVTSRPAPIATSNMPFAVNIDIGGQRMTELLIDPLRKTIRNKGGNVQVVLSGK